MPGPTPSTSQSVTRTELPEWINTAAKENWQSAKDINPQIAEMSPTTTQAFQLFKDHVGSGATEMAAASDIYRKMADPAQFNTLVEGMMNPYINQVESKALSALDDTRQRALMGNADAATKAKAFGGSRSAVVDAITNAESAKDAGMLSSQLRSAGYTDAVNNLRSTANSLGTLGAQNFSTMTSIGNAEQAQKQKELNAPIDKLNMRLAALGMTPYESTSISNTSGTQGSPGFDWGAGGMGVLSILAGLL